MNDETTIENLKHLCRFLSLYHEQTMQLRARLLGDRALDADAIKEALAMEWPIVQGTVNHAALTKICRQDCDVAQAAAGMDLLTAETRLTDEEKLAHCRGC